MPGRKQTPVHSLFSVNFKDGLKNKRATCKFCYTEVADNGTRKVEHIRICIKCTDDIKFKFLGSGSSSAASSSRKSKKKKTAVGSTSEILLEQAIPENPDTEQPALPNDDRNIITEDMPHQDEQRKSTDIVTSVKQGIAPIFTSNSSPQSHTPSRGRPRSRSDSITPRKHSLSNIFKQPSLACVDSLSGFQNEAINEHLARAIFATGCPLSITENIYWKRYFAAVRPAYKPPSRYRLTNEYLNEEYSRINIKCNELLKQSSSVAILCDGWTNIRNEAIINFIVTTPKPIFWKSLASGSDSHTGEYMCNEIAKVVDEIGDRKVVGLCTDNAANMKKAWELLHAKYPNLNCYGCLAHGLNLIFSDALKIPSVCKIMAECTALIKCIKNSHLLLAKFSEKQAHSKTAISLKLPVKTRWGSSVACLQSLLANKQALRALAIEEDVAVSQNLTKDRMKTILSEVFWDRVEGFHNLFSPVAQTITKVEGDEPLLSVAVKYLNNIVKSAKETAAVSPLLKTEESTLIKIIEKRRTFCLTKIHLVANLLDPRFRGEDLSAEENVDAFERVHEICQAMLDVDERKAMADLSNFSSKRAFFSKEYLWSAVDYISPSTWWVSMCKTSELSKVATRILDLPATSAACERSFSAHANIHSKKRNRLTNEHAAKLVYISQNLSLFECSIDHQIQVTSSEAEPEHAVESSASNNPIDPVPGPSTSGTSKLKKRPIQQVDTDSEMDSDSTSEEEDCEVPYDDESDASLHSLADIESPREETG